MEQDMSDIIKINSANFDAEVKQSGVPVLVDFGATWCGPCQALHPTIAELATEYGGSVKIAEVDIDESQELAAMFGVMSVPTLLFFRGGEVVDKQVGALSKNDLKKRIDAVASGAA